VSGHSNARRTGARLSVLPRADCRPVHERAWLDQLRGRLPELPDARRARYLDKFALSAYDAEALSTDVVTAQLFEPPCIWAPIPKGRDWIQNDVSRLPVRTAGNAAPEHLAS